MKYLFTVLLLSLSLLSQAQSDAKKFKYKGKLNFALIKAQADSFFALYPSKVERKEKEEEHEDNDYFRYKRWEWYWKNRVNPDGSFPDMQQQASLYNQVQTSAAMRSASQSSPWVNISQSSTSGGYDGMGRLTSIAFHPGNQDIFWVGAPIGGIWKTIDGGASYSPLGDNLPYCSVGNIVVNPQNPDIIYITLGDHGGWWNYGLGVYKTTDGGITWNPTSLTSDFSDGVAYYAMVMSPSNPNIILVAASDGLHRTINGGQSWSIAHTGGHKDVKFRANDSTTVFASTDDYWGSSEVYKSTNAGASFTKISAFNTAQNTIKLTVSPANPNILGIMVSGNNLKSYYKSSNNGSSINFVSTIPEDAVIFISPSDSNSVYCGYTKVHHSLNGGQTWTQLTNWYNDGVHPEVHADEHFVSSNPLNNAIYFCNDGGLYNYDEVFDTWAELNNGLIITQFYTIAISQTNPVFMIGGTQDNGGRKRTGLNSWSSTNGGDAMETAIDQTNNQTIYTTYVSGQLYRSLDQWVNDTYFDITPPGATGSWVTPYMLDPTNQSTIYAGYEDVYKSTNKGITWNKISTNLTGASTNHLAQLEVSPSNSAVIYTCRDNIMFTTTNAGTNWVSHTLPFSTNNFSEITSIAIDPQLSSTVYVTVGGYSAGKKVYRSINSGTSWINISGTLPNIPVSACIFDSSSATHEFYIGTDIGVFYINDSSSIWTYLGNNLPNTSVTDLKIQYATRKLRAATFGRGIWETDLISVATKVENEISNPNENHFASAYNPVGNLLMLNAGIRKDVDCELRIFDATGKLVWTKNQHFQQGNYQVPIDISALSEGIFFLKINSGKEQTSIKLLHNAEN